MKNILLIAVAWILLCNASAQTIELSFTAVVDQSFVQLDSIKIMNRTQDGDTVLVYPDTVLSITSTGMNNFQGQQPSLSVSVNQPNPFVDQTTFQVYLPVKEELYILVHDGLGREVSAYRSIHDVGSHGFILQGAKRGWYILTALTSYGSQSLKIYCLGSGSNTMNLVYSGDQAHKSADAQTTIADSFPYAVGDNLLFIGYFNTFTGVLESGILDTPEESKVYTFQFATNIPCPGAPTVDYEGQIYNTIQIFSQCWLKENLNVGEMINGSMNQSNNGTIEKYCYNNEPDSCVKYGGLYTWWEMMQYTTQQGTQGICPPGWHLPTDEEFKVLEGAVDSQYGIGDTTWDSSGIRGYDVGMNLKTTSGWYNNGNGTDLYGFSALPGGKRESDGSFTYMGVFGIIWASTEDSYSYSRFRSFACQGPELARGIWSKSFGHSVRCLRDD